MPNPRFNDYFLTAHDVLSVNQEVLTSAYQNQAPIYFLPTSDEETAAQLRQFKSSERFHAFRNQYEILITFLIGWCHKKKCLLSAIPDEMDGLSGPTWSF